MQTRTRRTLTALLAGAALLLPAAPAHARPIPDVRVLPSPGPDQPVPVSPGTPFTVTGDGFGHGHGMSQYGASGAARAGLTAAQILNFYYPHTATSSLSTGIRVLITADTDNNLIVFPERGLRVRDLGNGRTYWLHTRSTPKRWRLMQKYGHTRVYYKTSRWHLYKTGGRLSLAGDGEFRSSTGTLTLRLPVGSRTYRGALRYTHTDTVNVLSLENYLRGVIAAEMPSLWPAAALQAQAVAARTYAARSRADNLARYYQICDTTACQVYGGVARETTSTNAAAAATAGQVLTYGGQYAFAQFSASNGGWTSDGGQPYLVAQPDPYDTAYRHWQVPADPARLQAAYPQIGTPTSVQVFKREGNRLFDAGGWVQTVRIVGTSMPQGLDISGDDFRRIYGLRSAYFTFDPVPSSP